jgi:hypothetical protein
MIIIQGAARAGNQLDDIVETFFNHFYSSQVNDTMIVNTNDMYENKRTQVRIQYEMKLITMSDIASRDWDAILEHKYVTPIDTVNTNRIEFERTASKLNILKNITRDEVKEFFYQRIIDTNTRQRFSKHIHTRTHPRHTHGH